MKPVFRHLGTFKDPDLAEKCVNENALRLVKLMLGDKYYVGIVTDKDGHHVNLYEREQ